MIGTFWNLCRACPSLPSDKGRSEYRSTYQWYEYTGPREDVIKQPPVLTSPVKQDGDANVGFLPGKIQKPSDEKQTDVRFKNSEDELNKPPEVNIKQNPIYGRRDIYPGKVDQVGNPRFGLFHANPHRLRSRQNKRDYAPSRRSKSEGPPRANGKKKDRYTKILYGYTSPEYASIGDADAMDSDGPEYVIIQNCPEDGGVAGGSSGKIPGGHTEYRLQYAWPKGKVATVADENSAPEIPAKHVLRRAINSGEKQQPVPVHKKRLHDMAKQDGAPELEPLVAQTDEGAATNGAQPVESKPAKRNEFHTEYKKNFRPFSQYEYISGKFQPKQDDVDASSVQNGSWFEEVLELRKKAGEYKHRGWGTELVPQHLAEVYRKQLELWEHVSRRSSLSALTLATTMQKPRALTKAEKSKETFKKAIPGKARDMTTTLTRQQSIDRSGIYRKGDKHEDGKRGSFRGKKDFPTKHATVSSASSQGTQSDTASGSPKRHHSRTGAQFSSPGRSSEGHSRPTTLEAKPAVPADASEAVSPQLKNDALDKTKSTNKSSLPVFTNTINQVVKDKNQERCKINAELNTHTNGKYSRSRDMDDDFVFSGPIIKSPPEPTRLKSPEQLLTRSPEPVVWTIPLDTAKMFTVTQSILRGGDDKHVRFSDGISTILVASDISADRKPSSQGTVSTLVVSVANNNGLRPSSGDIKAIVESKMENGLDGDEKVSNKSGNGKLVDRKSADESKPMQDKKSVDGKSTIEKSVDGKSTVERSVDGKSTTVGGVTSVDDKSFGLKKIAEPGEVKSSFIGYSDDANVSGDGFGVNKITAKRQTASDSLTGRGVDSIDDAVTVGAGVGFETDERNSNRVAGAGIIIGKESVM